METKARGAGYDAEMLSACVEIGKLLTSTLDLEEILGRIMATAGRFVTAQNWSLLLADEVTGELSFQVVVGLDRDTVKDIRLSPGQGVAGLVARSGQPVFVEEAGGDPRVDRQVDRRTGFTTRSIACLPLSVHDKVLGVIEVVNLADMARFRSRELPMLEILADYAAIALENNRCVEKIRRLSLTDEYTGLYNARHLHLYLEQLIARGVSPIAVAFVDIDCFKEVVDTYGHLKGSHVLKEIGRAMQRRMGAGDVLVKYGGDEYVVVMPGRDGDDALVVVEALRRAVRDGTYLADEPEPVRVTASFGLAVYPTDAAGKKELLLAADHAMYRIKRETKDGIGRAEGGTEGP